MPTQHYSPLGATFALESTLSHTSVFLWLVPIDHLLELSCVDEVSNGYPRGIIDTPPGP